MIASAAGDGYRAGDRLLRSHTRLVLLWLAGAVLALLCVTVTLGNVAGLPPEFKLKLWPRNGFAYANAALDLSNARQAEHRLSVGDAARLQRLAIDALRSEPLATRAWATLGTTADATGRHAAAAALMRASLGLSRRDELTNMWMVRDAARRGDLAGTMRAIDRAVLTSPATSSLYMPALVTALANDSTLAAFVPVLRTRPVWALDFWRAATVAQPALRNAGELRARLALTGPGDREVTAVLLRALGSAGHYETAEHLYRSAQPRVSPEIVHNGDFRGAADLPVFDWDLTSNGGFSAAIDPRAGVMGVNAVPGDSGTVARQLVVLARGHYRLTASLARPFTTADTTATIRLRCAREGFDLVALELHQDRAAADFDEPHGCRYVWLSVDATAREGQGDEDLAINRIAVVPR